MNPTCRRSIVPLLVSTVCLAAVSAPACAGDATGAASPPLGEPVLGSHVVRLHREGALRSGKERIVAQAHRLAAEHGGRVGRVYDTALAGFQFLGTDAQASSLANHSSVQSVTVDRVLRLPHSESPPRTSGEWARWSLDRIDQRRGPRDKKPYAPYGDGAGVTAYILDSGVRATHSEFEGRASLGFDATGGDGGDALGHGTHVAASVAGKTFGVARRAQIVNVRVIPASGAGTESTVLAGIDWVTKNARKPAVVTMSLGAPDVAVVDDAVRASIAAGIHYVFAAGNGGKDFKPLDACTISPARVAEGLTVSASTNVDGVMPSGNIGRCVDLYAPGVMIESAASASDQEFATKSGTSMAAPHVAGAVALVLGRQPDLTPAQIHEALVRGATPKVMTNPAPDTVDSLLYVGPPTSP